MTPTRRLAAILAADVAGYSAAMERDEEGTFAQVQQIRRKVIEPKLAEHQGRLIKTTGDGFLAEFASPIQAMKAALAIQAELGSAPSLRIGLNLGDVIVEESGDVFGEGVNIAARLEGLAEPGGILVSDKIVREVEGKVEAAFEDRGEQQVKNIAKAVRIYAVRTAAPPAVAAFVSPGSSLLLPDKPSIAVLPFQNMSADPDQEYLADGMAEDIITALSRFRSLFVIARNSSFAYKSKAVDIKQVGRELGVRYVLEGSVRKVGSTVRITGQLIDAETGAHLWANKFDGSIHDIFELQDNIVTSVVGEIVPQLVLADTDRVARKPSDSWDSYDHYLRGLGLWHQRTLEAFKLAQAEFQTAVDLDPNFALAHVRAAFCVHNRYWNFFQPMVEEERSEAVRMAARAVELAPYDDEVLCWAATIFGTINEEIERGISLVDRSLQINPNLAFAWGAKGYLSALMGNVLVARPALDRALRLSPLDRATVIGTLRGYLAVGLAMGSLEEQALWAQKLVAVNPADPYGLVRLHYIALVKGNTKEAEDFLTRIRQLYPHLRKPLLREMYLKYGRFQKPEHHAVMQDIVERIAIPE